MSICSGCSDYALAPSHHGTQGRWDLAPYKTIRYAARSSGRRLRILANPAPATDCQAYASAGPRKPGARSDQWRECNSSRTTTLFRRHIPRRNGVRGQSGRLHRTHLGSQFLDFLACHYLIRRQAGVDPLLTVTNGRIRATYSAVTIPKTSTGYATTSKPGARTPAS